MAIGAILLAVLAALLVFLLLPRCNEGAPQALVKLKEKAEKADHVDERLPRSIEPLHYRWGLAHNKFLDFSRTDLLLRGKSNAFNESFTWTKYFN